MSVPARFAVLALCALMPVGEAAAQMTYGQCADRARDRYMRGQVDPVIGPDRALDLYRADLRECVSIDAQNRRHDTRVDQQRTDQQRLDQQRSEAQRIEQQRDQQRAEQQRLDQQRADQQRLDQLRARQREDMLRNRR
ncbi:MAG: hypothetical protein HY060_26445 [Proteobacteria bacterium]|nr:hypothetical protein [Pseudomonadota bacterium]